MALQFGSPESDGGLEDAFVAVAVGNQDPHAVRDCVLSERGSTSHPNTSA